MGVNEAAVADPSSRRSRAGRRRHVRAVGTAAAAVTPAPTGKAVAGPGAVAGPRVVADDTAAPAPLAGVAAAPDAATPTGDPEAAGSQAGPEGAAAPPAVGAHAAADGADGAVAEPTPPPMSRAAAARPGGLATLAGLGVALLAAAAGIGFGVVPMGSPEEPGDVVEAYLTDVGEARAWSAYTRLCPTARDARATPAGVYGVGEFWDDVLARNAREGGPIREATVTGFALAAAPAPASARDITVLVQRADGVAPQVYRVDHQDGHFCLLTV
ncbi:hypothetical protein I6A81_24430 [Frankia sp. CN7]|uniref:hypothetical protein n=1 Tax=Frankia nepalensis TaxID=1836974 RepID=UPI001931829A|nr:hypothetical protein [Frankia nepalensis]MBL7499339.1 hypothetical protein [Frankia nepalensis]